MLLILKIHFIKMACINSYFDSLGTIGGRNGESWPLVFEKPNQQIYFRLCLSVWGAIFCMGTYKHNGVIVVKMGTVIFMGCLFSVGV